MSLHSQYLDEAPNDYEYKEVFVKDEPESNPHFNLKLDGNQKHIFFKIKDSMKGVKFSEVITRILSFYYHTKILKDNTEYLHLSKHVRRLLVQERVSDESLNITLARILKVGGVK